MKRRKPAGTNMPFMMLFITRRIIMEKCRIIFKPAVVPSAREQYLDLSRYFQEQGDIDLSEFYRELAENM